MNYRLSALGLPPYEGPPLDLTKAPYQVFVSSPNMDYIPDFSLDDQYVFVRKNGRFYTHDYTLWPQWYFEATKHLPFILRRPPAESLATHKLRLIWYDMTDTNFVREVGTIADVGRIRPEMVKELKRLRFELSDNIEALLLRLGNQPDEYRDMRYAQHGMMITSITLDCGPQSRLMTLLTFTAFQRYYLESLAFYEFYDKWNLRLVSASERLPVDTTIIGAVTCHLHVAQMFYQAGVPVWLFRAPYQLTSSIKVARMVAPLLEFDGLDNIVYPNTVCIMKSPPSAIRNKASQTLRVASVSIGPSAFEPRPGDFVPASCMLRLVFSMCKALIFYLNSFCITACSFG